MKSKKKFLLLGVGVMGALALGVGATSTFAWYVSANVSTISHNGDQADITTVSNSLNVGSFTVAVDTLSDISTLNLTDGSGHTWVNNGQRDVQISDQAVKMVAVQVNLTITYTPHAQETAPLTTATLNSLWESACQAHPWKVVASDATDYTTAQSRGKAIKDGAGSNPYGLKFGASATSYDGTDHEYDCGTYSYSARNDWDGTANTSDLVSNISNFATFYVGVWGINGFEQLTSDTYVLDVSPDEVE